VEFTKLLSVKPRSFGREGRLVADDRRSTRPPGQKAKAIRALVRAGCGPELLDRLASHCDRAPDGGSRPSVTLEAVAEFVGAIGRGAAQDYVRALRETGALTELTDPRVLAFARTVDPHTAEWYFWSVWGTKAVRELTSDGVLGSVEFFQAIDSPATVEYFLAIRQTRAVRELTDVRVLELAREIGS